MELVKELQEKLFNIIQKEENIGEITIKFEKEFIDDDLLVGGNGDETII